MDCPISRPDPNHGPDSDPKLNPSCGSKDRETSRDCGSEDRETSRDCGSEDRETSRDCGSEDRETSRDCGSEDRETSRDCGSKDRETSRDCGSEDRETSRDCGSEDRETSRDCGSEDRETSRDCGSEDRETSRDCGSEDRETSRDCGSKDRETSRDCGSEDRETSRDCGSEDRETSRDCGSEDRETSRDCGSEDRETSRDCGSEDRETSRDCGSEDRETSRDCGSEDRETSRDCGSKDRETSRDCGSEDRETSRDCGSELKRGKQDQPGPSCLSVKSHHSKDAFIFFQRNSERPGFCESVTSDWSKDLDINFRVDPPEDLRFEGGADVCGDGQTQLDFIFMLLEQQILTFVKEQLQRLHRLMTLENPESEEQSTGSSSESVEEQSSREAVLNITVDFLRRMEQEQLAERLRNKSAAHVCCRELKSHLQQRFSQVFEGVAKAGNSAPLQEIYTELYITEGGASEVNQEHEVRQNERASRKPTERAITCEEIFKQRPESDQPIRTVLTKGVAGVGKTVLTQKFSLDWAEGRAHQDVQLLFPFTFRELNVLRDSRFSLVELLRHFFSLTKGLLSFKDLQLLFIFDGLDECRLPLDFRRTRVLTDPTESASVEELLVNLIRGSLLPSAHLWITTRPAAADQIPAECVSMVTEVRGFTDEQKEQYFRKRFTDEQQATAVISHIKTSRSLFIMCHLPVICWIISTVLQKILEQTEKPELPTTLTEVYIHFLVVQAKVKNIRYQKRTGADLHWTEETWKMVMSLGKLAFEQLLKGNLILHGSGLSECGLDIVEVARYSGVFTEVFREEQGLYQDKVYCFIHLTVQEFLAAIHVHQTFYSSGENLLSPPHSSESSETFYRSAVDQALHSPNGLLDLFLRFILGLSLSTNQKLLQGLLTETGSDRTNQETVSYIKEKLNETGVSSERRLNLLHCLNELNDRSLVKEIQKVMREGGLSDRDVSPALWSALSFLLLSSDSDLENFDLRKYQASEKALLGLLPVVKASTKANLSCCNLTDNICGPDGPLASVLSSSSLTLLDLSNNDLQDSGVELLCEGLKSAPCRLDTLRLSGCLVSERGGASLASALSSASFRLRDLDLSYNYPGPSTELLKALQAPHGPLDSLRLDPAGQQFMVPGLRKYSCDVPLDPNTAHRRLHLSSDRRTVSCDWKKQLYPEHKDRFTDQYQVLSSTGLRGRCYWQVKWSGKYIDIAVSYRGIRRRGYNEESRFGDNNQSWNLIINYGQYSVLHNKRETRLSCSPASVTESEWPVSSGRVGVFLDSEAGALSFYRITKGDLIHLHTFSSSFTEPLFPGFGLDLTYELSVF